MCPEIKVWLVSYATTSHMEGDWLVEMKEKIKHQYGMKTLVTLLRGITQHREEASDRAEIIEANDSFGVTDSENKSKAKRVVITRWCPEWILNCSSLLLCNYHCSIDAPSQSQ